MNLNEQILQKLINDPSLIKMLEKMSKSIAPEKKAKKFKELGNPDYTNKVTLQCKLCGSSQVKYMTMSWDSEEKLYRTMYHGLDNKFLSLPIYHLAQRTSTCACCPGYLSKLSIEDLISKILYLSNK